MVVMGWRLFSLSVAAALLGARPPWLRSPPWRARLASTTPPIPTGAARVSRPCHRIAPFHREGGYPGEWKPFSRPSAIVVTPDQMIHVGDSESQSRDAAAYVLGAEVGPKDPKK
jgi:hypothetical protein